MAHEARLSVTVKPAVVGEANLQEGRLIRLTVSGVRDDLPVARFASSGTTINVYVAFVPPDTFSRPTPSQNYIAPRLATFYEGNAWGDNVETGTFYNVGASTLEDPVAVSGWGILAKLGGAYHVSSGCVVDSANIKIVGNLVKVSDDNTGRWEYTASESAAIGRVIDYDTAGIYTFETFRV